MVSTAITSVFTFSSLLGIIFEGDRLFSDTFLLTKTTMHFSPVSMPSLNLVPEAKPITFSFFV